MSVDSDLSQAEPVKPLRMVITQGHDSHFTMTYGPAAADGKFGNPDEVKRSQQLAFGELLEMVAKIASHNEVRGPVFDENPHFMIKHGRVPYGYAAVILPKDQAERLSSDLSDILCWAAGFKAALGDDLSRAPLGVEGVRDLNIKLKSAIQKVEA